VHDTQLLGLVETVCRAAVVVCALVALTAIPKLIRDRRDAPKAD
jgi:hypothetical protein